MLNFLVKFSNIICPWFHLVNNQVTSPMAFSLQSNILTRKFHEYNLHISDQALVLGQNL